MKKDQLYGNKVHTTPISYSIYYNNDALTQSTFHD